jgi:hypothetical protein
LGDWGPWTPFCTEPHSLCCTTSRPALGPTQWVPGPAPYGSSYQGMKIHNHLLPGLRICGALPPLLAWWLMKPRDNCSCVLYNETTEGGHIFTEWANNIALHMATAPSLLNLCTCRAVNMCVCTDMNGHAVCTILYAFK